MSAIASFSLCAHSGSCHAPSPPVHACRNAVIIHEYMFGNEVFRIRCFLIALLC